MKLDKTSRGCHSNCASFHARNLDRSPCRREAMRRMRRRARKRSHGGWLTRFAAAVPSWHRAPRGPAFQIAMQRLPSLGRRDNAGAFGRRVLRGLWSGACVTVYASNPRARRWLRRMCVAGIVECRDDHPAWYLAEQLRDVLRIAEVMPRAIAGAWASPMTVARQPDGSWLATRDSAVRIAEIDVHDVAGHGVDFGTVVLRPDEPEAVMSRLCEERARGVTHDDVRHLINSMAFRPIGWLGRDRQSIHDPDGMVQVGQVQLGDALAEPATIFAREREQS